MYTPAKVMSAPIIKLNVRGSSSNIEPTIIATSGLMYAYNDAMAGDKYFTV